MNKYSIMICGQALNLVSDESEDYVRDIARTINGTVREFNSRHGTKGISEETRLIYAAIQLSDELFKARAESARLAEERRFIQAEAETAAAEAAAAVEKESKAAAKKVSEAASEAARKIAALEEAVKALEAERDALQAEHDAFRAEENRRKSNTRQRYKPSKPQP